MNEANIYNQHCEFYRFQDKLRWNRFQTVAAIEAGILVAIQSEVGWVEKLLFLAFAALLVLLVTSIAWRDGALAEHHMNKIRSLEGKEALSERGSVTGASLMKIAVVVINTFNLVALPVYVVCTRG